MRRLFQATFVLLCLACLAPPALAFPYDSATKAQINVKVGAVLKSFYAKVPGSQDVVSRAAGVLVFPPAGFMVGGKHGGGALLIGDKYVDYYQTDRMVYAVRPGAANHSVVIAFMTPEALQRFQASADWDVGADPSVAIVPPGTGKVEVSQSPIQLFVFNDQGVLGPVTLAGAKVSKVG